MVNFHRRNAVWNTAPKYRFELKYPRGITMTIAGGYPDIKIGREMDRHRGLGVGGSRRI